ncbi:MAG: aminoacyl-tRNA hydrolase [Myxococcota bacterium]
MQLVVGLGNPGGRYARTRHNVGFMVVDRVARRWGASVERKQFKALVDSARVGSQSVVLCKPQTYMNLSGEAVVSLRGYYKVEPEDVLVVHDDVDLPLGDVRLKKGGGHGGHNGLRDLQGRLGTAGFGRVRVGVSRPPAGWDTADYVLADFRDDEQVLLEDSLDLAADAVEAALTSGLQAAMQKVNSIASGAQAGPSRS